MKAIIIEDEKPARDLLKNYLQEYPDIVLVAECADGFQGVKAINELKPDLILLDIQMPKLTGFEMLELLDFMPKIIFTTAYDEFAIKAFELSAVDYLLKPFSRERFDQAIQKLMNSDVKEHTTTINKLANHIQENTELIDRIVVKKRHKIVIIPIEKINYFEAEDDYVRIYTGEDKYLKKATMKYFESRLDPNQFIRIHRSYIVNINQIDQLEKYLKDAYIALLKDGTKLKISSSRYKVLKEVLNI